jgi:hypothetical protein
MASGLRTEPRTSINKKVILFSLNVRRTDRKIHGMMGGNIHMLFGLQID